MHDNRKVLHFNFDNYKSLECLPTITVIKQVHEISDCFILFFCTVPDILFQFVFQTEGQRFNSSLH